jgi:Zn-dependent protease
VQVLRTTGQTRYDEARMKIANLAGIPIRLHWSFQALVGAGVLYALVTQGLMGGVMAMALSVGLFGSVILHELGHSMAARMYGIRTRDITLYPFGGVAAIESMPRNPKHELVIALAGPAVNGVLFAFFLFAFVFAGGSLFATLAAMNLIMGVFNLIPAFPMDGGRVLRALLVQRMGWFQGSELAIRIGSFFAWSFIVIGVVAFIPSLLLVGGFLLFALAGEKTRLRQEAMNDLRTGRVRWEQWQANQEPAYTPKWRVNP